MTEPPLTLEYTLEHLESRVESGNVLKFPDVPCHSQGVERMVKLVTKVSKSVKSFRRRNEDILSILFHRAQNPNEFDDPDEFDISDDEDSDVENDE